MQVPYRKPGKFSQLQADPMITAEKYAELEKELDNLKKVKRPFMASEVKRLAENGDFSENAEYQLAKGRLRGINSRIFVIELELKQAIIIPSNEDKTTVQVGHSVTVESDGKQKIFHILGSAETNPGRGVISRNSPVGAALIGHGVGECVSISLVDKQVLYTILKIA